MEEMDQPTSLDSNSARTGSTHASNKRKRNNTGGERIVVAVKMQGNCKKKRNEGSPSDCWSWRKYGQKPIKGSPYPRGYYRCSTSKNCSAKKQVERCKTDSTTLLITYTCSHNHPEPHDNPSSNQKQEPEEGTPKQEQERAEYEHEQETPVTDINDMDQADHFQSFKFTFNSPQDHLVEENPSNVLIYNENLQRSSLPMDFSDLKSEENDFYDELEELPTSSFFTALMRSDFCGRRILLNPS